jgi:hypothetical protein
MPRYFVHLWIDDRCCPDLKPPGHASIQEALRDAVGLAADALTDDLTETDAAEWEVRMSDRAGRTVLALSVPYLMCHARLAQA